MRRTSSSCTDIVIGASASAIRKQRISENSESALSFLARSSPELTRLGSHEDEGNGRSWVHRHVTDFQPLSVARVRAVGADDRHGESKRISLGGGADQVELFLLISLQVEGLPEEASAVMLPGSRASTNGVVLTEEEPVSEPSEGLGNGTAHIGGLAHLRIVGSVVGSLRDVSNEIREAGTLRQVDRRRKVGHWREHRRERRERRRSAGCGMG